MAPAEDDISIEEKRVYAGSADRTDAYVATETGVVRAAISGDKIGEFELAVRDPARDVAVLGRPGAADLLAVATAEALSVAPVGDDPAFVPAGIGPAVAVGVHGGAFLVADAGGAIHRVDVDAEPGAAEISSTDASRIGSVDDPRAIDGPLVAAADGVHRVTGAVGPSAVGDSPTVEAAGLEDARDVAGAGVPLAATSTGLHWLGNGWMAASGGDATAVAADGDGHAMAVVDGDLLVHPGADEVPAAPTGGIVDDGWDADSWTDASLPVEERPAALGYGPGVSVAVTDAGTLCVDAGDGWRHQALGVPGVAGVALAAVE
jgi:hypothetical protein